MPSGRPTRAEIDLSAIRRNLLNVRALLAPGVRLCAVVKADGYGHGAVPVAREAVRAGADYLAVAILDEALELRAAGLEGPVLILGYTPPEDYPAVLAAALTQTVFSLEQAKALSAAAKAAGTRARAHLKVDSGMGRLGVQAGDAAELAARVATLPSLELEGVFTHFAKADSRDKSFTRQQFAAFMEALDAMRAAGIRVPIRHCCNSAATLDLPEMHLDMVRVGIALYGLRPSEETGRPFELLPAMCFKTSIVQIKTLPPGRCVSYGCIYATGGEERIATLPVGYADGFSRLLSGKTEVLVCGSRAPQIGRICRAPQVGRICMDQCMIDVSAVPGASEGDDVVLFGAPELTADEVAARLGTINYELVCMVGRRVPRVYTGAAE